MTTMNVSLPAEMKDWVDSRTETGRYGNASEYVRDLIRKDQEREQKIAAMQKLVDEGRASGISTRTIEQIFEEAVRRTEGVSDGVSPDFES